MHYSSVISYPNYTNMKSKLRLKVARTTYAS